MANQTAIFLASILFFTGAILCIAVCSWMIAFDKDWKHGDYFYGDVNYLTQIGRDWNTLPF